MKGGEGRGGVGHLFSLKTPLLAINFLCQKIVLDVSSRLLRRQIT